LKATGYSEKDLIWIPISGLTGANIIERVDPQKCSWYKGPTFLELMDTVELDTRYPEGPLRVPILDKMKDPNILVSGKIENGSIKVGDKLAIMPTGAPAQVLGLQDAKN